MDEKKSVSTFSKVTGILCVLTIILCVCLYFVDPSTQVITSLNKDIEEVNDLISDFEDVISDHKDAIKQAEKRVETLEEERTALQSQLNEANTAKTKAQSAYDDAEKALDTVCYRGYYRASSCTEECKPLHDAVTQTSSALSDAKSAVSELKDKMEDIADQISALQEQISDHQQDIDRNKEYISTQEDILDELKEERRKAWFTALCEIAAMIAVAAGLFCFTRTCFTDYLDMFAQIGCAALSLASVLYLISGSYTDSWAEFLLNPHLYNLVIMGCFLAVIRSADRTAVVLRTVAIVAAVIVAVLGFAAGNVFGGLLYAAAMICVAFVLVPLVFTEYISIAKHLFLSLITCGIWVLVWIYHVTKNLNKVEENENRDPAWELFLCFLLPLYWLFWLMKSAEYVENYGKANDKIFALELLCLGFGLLCPLFSTVLIQNKINVIVGKPQPAEAIAE